MLNVYIDADACPVKEEVYRVAERYRLRVTLVANSRMRVPSDPRISLEVVAEGPDVADDWIVEHVAPWDIVITSDIPLASRCVHEGARAISPSGKPFTEDNVGEALALRDLMTDLRSSGELTGGPPPLTRSDRSRFLQKLDDIIQAIRREQGAASC